MRAATSDDLERKAAKAAYGKTYREANMKKGNRYAS